MKEQDILKAFNGRWRIKSEAIIANHQEQCPITYEVLRNYCLDFFRTGITIGQLNNENDTYGICNSSIVREDELALATSFENWWTIYDKKCGRKDCEKKWNKLSPAEQQACMDATPSYVAATPDKQYRKNPLTYLNQKAWNDEIIPRNNGTNNKPTIDEQRREKLASVLTD